MDNFDYVQAGERVTALLYEIRQKRGEMLRLKKEMKSYREMKRSERNIAYVIKMGLNGYVAKPVRKNTKLPLKQYGSYREAIQVAEEKNIMWEAKHGKR